MIKMAKGLQQLPCKGRVGRLGRRIRSRGITVAPHRVFWW